MDGNLVKEIQDCLRGERTLFNYYQDQYAVYMLSRLVSREKRIAIRHLRCGRLASLLSRPVVKDLLSKCGDGFISKKILDDCWHESLETYVLTLGDWGCDSDRSWDQVSRPGKNLVLQLNVSKKWAAQFQRILKMPPNQFFDSGHPLSNTRTMTLAWARLDIDFETDEALIEEIQSDSIRDIANVYRRAGLILSKGKKRFSYYGYEFDAQIFIDVAGPFLDRFKKSWQEAMLTAAISFILDELGIGNVYYHSFETGNKMKNVRWSHPPRSLYTDLPQKFCFDSNVQAPEFLWRDKRVKRKLKKLEGGCWFYLAA